MLFLAEQYQSEMQGHQNEESKPLRNCEEDFSMATNEVYDAATTFNRVANEPSTAFKNFRGGIDSWANFLTAKETPLME